MAEQFEVQERFAVSPDVLYQAWLDSDTHAAMTGGFAVIDPAPGGVFTAWDDYISGTTIEVEKNRRIVQSWRTTEFTDDDADSRIEIELEADGNVTVLTLRHSKIPDGQGDDYRQGWTDHYFVPMHQHFGA